MGFLKIKTILHKTIGLDAETVGESSIDRAINHRLDVTGCSNSKSYYELLKSDGDEVAELIEEVVVPETWFFRNVVPFEVLRKNALKLHSGINNTKSSSNGVKKKNIQLRVLSVPCSSGEEPYSIAMALRDGGLDGKDFVIEAVDVSKRALTKARRGIYGKHSFREKGVNLKDRYFKKIKSGYRILPEISEQVMFHKGNILSEKVSPSGSYYDIIFCRNLLIYFDRETQINILNKLSGMLKSGGLLFVGHAEVGQIDKDIYSKVHVEKSFAFRKKSAETSVLQNINSDDPSINKLKDIYDQLVEVTKKDIELSKQIISPKRKEYIKLAEDKKDVFSEVDKMINSGHLSDALKKCEKYLKSNPESSDAYYYLGLINSLQGSSGGAESLLRKAIYLSPKNHKALALSAVLAEKRGDEEGAKSLRRREKKARDSG